MVNNSQFFNLDISRKNHNDVITHRKRFSQQFLQGRREVSDGVQKRKLIILRVFDGRVEENNIRLDLFQLSKLFIVFDDVIGAIYCSIIIETK